MKHTLVHPVIRDAMANVARHRLVNLGVARLRVFREQRRCRHQLPGLAIAALEQVLLDSRTLHRVEPGALRQPLDRRDALPAAFLRGVWQDRTAIPPKCTVHAPHKPRPQPNFAPDMPSYSQNNLKKGRVRSGLHFDRLTVYREF